MLSVHRASFLTHRVVTPPRARVCTATIASSHAIVVMSHALRLKAAMYTNVELRMQQAMLPRSAVDRASSVNLVLSATREVCALCVVLEKRYQLISAAAGDAQWAMRRLSRMELVLQSAVPRVHLAKHHRQTKWNAKSALWVDSAQVLLVSRAHHSSSVMQGCTR